jgi:acyl-CoA thioesterase-1
MRVSEAEKNLSGVIEKAQSKGIKVILAGMQMPTNYGEAYRKDFSELFTKLAKKYHLTLIPFLLEGVATKPELNLPDGIHPNPKGHEMIAKTVMKYLEPEL